MEEIHHSSAYSSLANSTTEINEKTNMNASLDDSKCVDQMRHITDDYNTLLKRATDEIKSLAGEKYDLHDQCEKLMTVNEELVGEMSKMVRREAELKKENEAVIKANNELFEEAQRLSDEEEKWLQEKEKFQTEIASLKEQIEEIEATVSAVSERESDSQGAIEELKEVNSRQAEEHASEKKALREANRKLEAQILSFKSRINTLENEVDRLQQKKEKVSGENLQLMVEADGLAKQHYHKTVSLQTQLQKTQEKCRDLERENARLKRAGASAADADLSEQQAERYEKLLEKNKNLTDWREQLIGKNKVLSEENAKLKAKCQNLEELLHEEETDINDVLELIKNMQVPANSNVNPGSMVGPISKFRDLKKLKK